MSWARAERRRRRKTWAADLETEGWRRGGGVSGWGLKASRTHLENSDSNPHT